jgi:hypothetical protein
MPTQRPTTSVLLGSLLAMMRIIGALCMVLLAGCLNGHVVENGEDGSGAVPPNPVPAGTALDIRTFPAMLVHTPGPRPLIGPDEVGFVSLPPHGWSLLEIRGIHDGQREGRFLLMGAFTANGSLAKPDAASWTWARVLYPGEREIGIMDPYYFQVLNGLQISLGESRWASGMLSSTDGDAYVDGASTNHIYVLVAAHGPRNADALTLGFAWHSEPRSSADRDYGWALENVRGRNVTAISVLAQGVDASLAYRRTAAGQERDGTGLFRAPVGETGPVATVVTRGAAGATAQVDMEATHKAMRPGFSEAVFDIGWQGPYEDLRVTYQGSNQVDVASAEVGLHLPTVYYVQEPRAPRSTMTYLVGTGAAMDDLEARLEAISLLADADLPAITGLDLASRSMARA